LLLTLIILFMPVAIVTGANRGIGREVSKQLINLGYVVLVTGRDRDSIIKTAEELREETGVERVEPFVVDVTKQETIDYLIRYIQEHFIDEVQILVNNAGVYLDGWTNDSHIFRVSPEIIQQTFEVNTLGSFRMMQAIVPLMIDSKKPGRVVNVSSGMGQLQDMGGGSVGYRVSKASLNALTKILASEVKGMDILINSVCPGWVKTDMGGENASVDLSAGAAGVVWAATLPKDGPSGGFFRHNAPIAW
jgi:NAD(P)-dependent dehydrogenase (short-subunit alcohol dehydrogenase family)